MPKKETESTEQKPEKVVTKYDLKMQRRKEQKEKELREKRISTIIGMVAVAAVVCLVASFPIRSWITVNGTYIEVGGEKVTRPEFDYNYGLVSNNFISQYYTTYLYYLGVDLTGDLSTQMYSSTLTWQDYFDQLAVDNISRNKALLREGKAAGFTYDVTEDYQEYLDTLKSAAEEAGVTQKAYLKELYGAYATESRLKPYIEDALYAIAYSETITEKLTPSQEEIQAYYDENKEGYDSVDYYLLTVDAKLPEEPTELADPVDEEAEAAADGEEQAYQPSEAEIAAAMEAAKAEADEALDTVKTEGELSTNVKRASATSLLRGWLFDEERKAGDSTVIEDTSGHRYYVVEFENRYLDHATTADIRLIAVRDQDAQAILDEWKGGEATAESFGALSEQYTDPEFGLSEGGRYVGVRRSALHADMGDWIFDSARKEGDTTIISPDTEEYTYVLYYVSPNEEEWVLDIQNTLLNEKVAAYMDELLETIEVSDPNGCLAYLKEENNPDSGSSESDSQESSEESSEESESGEDVG